MQIYTCKHHQALISLYCTVGLYSTGDKSYLCGSMSHKLLSRLAPDGRHCDDPLDVTSGDGSDGGGLLVQLFDAAVLEIAESVGKDQHSQNTPATSSLQLHVVMELLRVQEQECFYALSSKTTIILTAFTWA